MCLALPGQVKKIFTSEDQLLSEAEVDFNGVVKKINTAFIDDLNLGDYVIVHAGVALQKLNQEEAEETLRQFKTLDECESHGSRDSMDPKEI